MKQELIAMADLLNKNIATKTEMMAMIAERHENNVKEKILDVELVVQMKCYQDEINSLRNCIASIVDVLKTIDEYKLDGGE